MLALTNLALSTPSRYLTHGWHTHTSVKTSTMMMLLTMVQALLIPYVTVGGGKGMPGCFTHEGGVTITKGQLFLWEMIMTFVLVSTVYAVAVTKPGHGNIGPLAVGFSLFASAFIGRPAAGACLVQCLLSETKREITSLWPANKSDLVPGSVVMNASFSNTWAITADEHAVKQMWRYSLGNGVGSFAGDLGSLALPLACQQAAL